MGPQDEMGFAYANQHAQVLTQAPQTLAQMGSMTKKSQHGSKFTIEEDNVIVST